MTTPPDPHPVVERSRLGFKLDLGRCVGCGACVLACRIENRLPMGVSWRRVLQVNGPRIGGGPTFHLSVSCHHCENPPCAQACPSGALRKGAEGLVLLNSDLCLGCRYCEMACPFGAPSFDAEAGVMTKCHLCHHRLAEGLSPACVVACPTGALGHLPAEEGQDGSSVDDARESAFRWAVGIPGFADPTGANPGFWVSEPGGELRSNWFRELETLLKLSMEEPDESR